MAYARFKVAGMEDGRDERDVEGILGGFTGVSSRADHGRGMVEVVYDKSNVTARMLEQSLRDAGYAVEAEWTASPWEKERNGGRASSKKRELTILRASGACGCG